MTPEKRSKLMLAATLAMFAAIAFLAWDGDRRAFLGADAVTVKRDPDGLVFAWRGEVRAPMAQRFAEVFDELDLDLEAPLERLFGPIAAHRMGQAARRFLGWGRQAAATLGEDAVEFLREETGDLVHAEDVEAWMDAVDSLRSDTDRLEARIRRLERKLTEA